MNTTNKYLTAKDFLIELSLYEVVSFNDENLQEGQKLYCFNEALDSYCPDCGQHSIFSRISNYRSYEEQNWVNQGRFSIELQCSRNNDHQLYFLFIAKEKTIQKIGQFPSVASLNLFDVKQYSKVIDNKYYKELTKAIGLSAHGIGIGSFVYLRRIFEYLIEEAHNELKKAETWDENTYSQARMSEKIEILKAELPAFLVENKSMYSILSKGIHELDENDCLDMFPIVKAGIKLILDDKLEKMNKQKTLEEAKKAISELSNKMSTGK